MQGEGRAAKMHAATIATGVCGLVAGAAYIYSIIQRRQVRHASVIAFKQGIWVDIAFAEGNGCVC